MTQAKNATGREIEQTGAHEILSGPVPHPTGEDTLVARSHGSHVDELEIGLIPASCSPAKHPAPMTVNPIPHDPPDKSANLLEAGNAVELCHAHRYLIATFFAGEAWWLMSDEVRFAATCAKLGVGLHFLDQLLEVNRWQ